MTAIIFYLGLASIFFLPVIESFSREWALNFLILGSILMGLTVIKSKISWGKAETLFLLVLTIFTVSIFTSWSISRSYLELLRYLAYFVIYLSIKNYYQKENLIRSFLIPSVLINSFILSLIYLSYFLPIKLFPFPSTGMNLYFSNFGYNRMAIILIFAIPITLSTIFIFQKVLIRKLLSLVIIFFLAVLVMTNGRGAMLSLALSMIAGYFLFFRKSRMISSRQLWIRFASVLGVITIAFLTYSFVYSNFLKTSNSGEYLRGIYKPAAYEQRLDYFSQSIAGFIQSPILGTGLDTFRYVSKIYQKAPFTWSWYVHNHFLQIFQESGIFGGMVFLALIYLLLTKLFRTVRDRSQSSGYNLLPVGIFTAILASTIHSLIDYDWQYLSIFLYYWIGIAVLFRELVSGKIIVEKFSKIILLLTVFAIYFIYIIIPLDTESLYLQAKNIEPKDPQKAKKIYSYIYRIDPYNLNNTVALANFYENNKSFNLAHRWYRISISLAPLESSYVILNDYRLYLDQAQNLLNRSDLINAYELIVHAHQIHTYAQNFTATENYLEQIRKNMENGDWQQVRTMLSDFIDSTRKELLNTDFSQIDLGDLSNRFKVR